MRARVFPFVFAAIKRKRSRVFIKTFLFVSGISLLGLSAAGIMAFHFASRQITSQVATAARWTLHTSVAAIEERLARVNSIALQTAFSQDTLRLTSSGMVDTRGRLMARDMIVQFGNVLSANRWIYSMSLVDLKHELVVSGDVVASSAYPDQESLSIARAADSAAAMGVRRLDGTQVLTLVYPYSLLSGSTTAAVVINLDYRTFFETFRPDETDAVLLVLDERGLTIYPQPGAMSGPEREAVAAVSRLVGHPSGGDPSGERLFVVTMDSNEWPWTYAYVQTYASMVGAVVLLRRLIVGSLLLVAALSTGLAYAVAVRLYEPLSNLVERVEQVFRREHERDGDEYFMVDTALDELATENARLQAQYRAVLPFFRRYSITEFLQSRSWDEDRFRTVLRLLGIRFTRRNTFVILVEDRFTDAPTTARHIEAFFDRREADMAAVSANEGNGRVAILLNCDLDERGALELTAELTAELGQRGVTAVSAISPSFQQLSRIPEFFSEALRRIEELVFFGIEGIATHQASGDAQEAPPPSAADRIEASINDLDPVAFRTALDRFLSETHQVESDSVARARFLFYHVGSRLQDAAARLGIGLPGVGSRPVDLFARAETLRTVEDLNAALVSMFDAIVTGMSDLKRHRRADTVRSAISYLEMNYHRDISVEDVASAVYLSSRYLNGAFTAETGKSIHQVLTGIRMERAAALLRECPDDNVGSIANAVGYGSASSFTRMFRSYVGMTPVQYRRQLARQGRSVPRPE